MNFRFAIALALLMFPVAIHAQSSPPQARLYDIGIYVVDLDRSAAFYQKVFGLTVTRRWEGMVNHIEGGADQNIPLAGMFLEDAVGNKFEFLQQGISEKRQVSQQPINHFSFVVADVSTTLSRALDAGAQLVFPDTPVFFTTIGDLSVEHTQIIGLDGERIQILREINQ